MFKIGKQITKKIVQQWKLIKGEKHFFNFFHCAQENGHVKNAKAK